ncbi:cyclic GMP-AMP synthase DncV-like nucleotidyltransferase [Tsuneonella amylolytica]|uniref:cyclic GMP-AMP synthase DncV-like nucleotidyltransferase n=1 Tax=Tsuneonella amylolytica TaxID=2338327 RepID=UPI0013C423F1|nr:hypothetical protein [Tsuneonella amylolytica]
MFDYSKKITRFHDDHVTLTMSLRRDMKTRRDNNKKRIVDGLGELEKPSVIEWINQGGYAQQTMTQPPEGDEESRYDIDMGAVFAEGESKTPTTTKNWVRDAIATKATNMKNDPVSKPKCVRVVYADGYQCDFPVFRTAPATTEGYELAAGDTWVASDPKSMNAWIDERVLTLSPDSSGVCQLRQVIRLTKYFSKVKSFKKGLKYPSGLLATAIAIECYTSSEGRLDHAFRETLRCISLRSKYSAVFANGIQISDQKDADRIQRLIDSAKDAVSHLDGLEDDVPDEEVARKAWKKVFQHSFFNETEFKSAALAASGAAFGISAGEQKAHALSAASSMKNEGIASKPYASDYE